jgi:two-component system, chemotaxis family, response regulator Rcp1
MVRTANHAEHVEILLVEDNPGDVELIYEALETGKVLSHISVVSDGERAISFLYRRAEYANAVRPDMILLDLNLPKKNGFEVLKEIKADPNLARIPVVVLTSSEGDRDILESYDLHANCYIPKPVDVEDFLAVVRSAGEFWLKIVKLPPPSGGKFRS